MLEQKQMQPRNIILIGGGIAITGIFFSSFQKQIWYFISLYGILSGVGSGMTYIVPLVCAFKYFPNKKGLITGIIVGSYGLGSSFFNLLATKIVNPNNIQADIKAPNGDPNLSFFPPEVADRVPHMFQSLCLIWSCLVIASASLISIPDRKQEIN